MNSDWKSKAVSADQAVSLIKSGMRIFIQGAAATPTPLIEAMSARRALENVKV